MDSAPSAVEVIPDLTGSFTYAYGYCPIWFPLYEEKIAVLKDNSCCVIMKIWFLEHNYMVSNHVMMSLGFTACEGCFVLFREGCVENEIPVPVPNVYSPCIDPAGDAGTCVFQT